MRWAGLRTDTEEENVSLAAVSPAVPVHREPAAPEAPMFGYVTWTPDAQLFISDPRAGTFTGTWLDGEYVYTSAAKVPVHGVWSDFSPSTTEWFSSPAGRYYYPGGDPADGRVWYPAAGERIHHGSAWGGVGADGYYWTATPASGSAHYFRLNASGVTQAYNMERYLGQSVRCIRLH